MTVANPWLMQSFDTTGAVPSSLVPPFRRPNHWRFKVSHIVTIKTEIRDPAAVAAACQRLELPAPVEGAAQLFSGSVTGLAVQLPGWHYPVVCETTTGQVKYDNFEGRWGDQKEL